MTASGSKDRPPVGILPYRVPPLSGLYRLRYHPPRAQADCLVDTETADSKGASMAGNPTAAARSFTSSSPSPSCAASLSAEDRHRRLHAQILRSRSLDDGVVDLFALYSLCEVTPVPCTQCNLHMETTLQTSSYRLRETYTVPAPSEAIHNNTKAYPTHKDVVESTEEVNEAPSTSLLEELQDGWYAFFFPMSECGRLKDNLLVCVNDALMAGDVAECDFEHDGVLRPLQKAAPNKSVKQSHAQPSLLPASPPAYTAPPFGQTLSARDVAKNPSLKELDGAANRVKPLFYYIVSPVPVHRKKGHASAGRGATAEEATSLDLAVTVSWRSYPATQHSIQSGSTGLALNNHKKAQKSSMFTLLYSYYCAPRTPDVLTCRAQFPAGAKLRLVRSPNCQGTVQLASEVTERGARVRVEAVDNSSLDAHRHPKDYTFQLCFHFGDYSSLIEETSWFAALVVFAVILLLLWFFLTKDLVV